MMAMCPLFENAFLPRKMYMVSSNWQFTSRYRLCSYIVAGNIWHDFVPCLRRFLEIFLLEIFYLHSAVIVFRNHLRGGFFCRGWQLLWGDHGSSWFSLAWILQSPSPEAEGRVTWRLWYKYQGNSPLLPDPTNSNDIPEKYINTC